MADYGNPTPNEHVLTPNEMAPPGTARVGTARVLMDVDRILRGEADAETALVLALARIESWLQTGDAP